ncbi:hypothetical protein D3C73_1391250 [compost metagenome]
MLNVTNQLIRPIARRLVMIRQGIASTSSAAAAMPSRCAEASSGQAKMIVRKATGAR